jgi:hypothetical protein
MDIVKEKQDQMADDIAKIKEAVYNPDEGLYARLRQLEAWKSTSSKLDMDVVYDYDRNLMCVYNKKFSLKTTRYCTNL